MSERDTHFAGFAKLLWDKLVNANEYGYIDVNTDDDGIDPTNYRLVIAQHAYDLVAHTVQETGLDQYDPATGYASATVEEAVNRIADFPHKPDS